MTKNDRNRVDAFEMWCYRRLLQTTWKDKRTNTRILEKIGTNLHLRSRIMKGNTDIFGHIVRRDWKASTSRCCGGKHGKARPSTFWIDDMKKQNKLSGKVCMMHHALQRIEMVSVLFWITTAPLGSGIWLRGGGGELYSQRPLLKRLLSETATLVMIVEFGTVHHNSSLELCSSLNRHMNTN